MATADQIIQNLEVMRGERSQWETHWQEVADYILPRKNDITSWKSAGMKRNTQILDNTGMQSCELLAGALHGLLTNPATLWFELTTGDDQIDQRDDARLWMQDTVLRMHNTFNNSNFQTEVHEVYLDLSGLCTASMSIEEDLEKDVRFQAHFLKEIYIRENNKGLVDEVYRHFTWEAKKIIQEFGMDVVSDEVKECFKLGKGEKFEIIHATYPASLYPETQKYGDKIVSKYVFVKDKKILREKTFNETPWVVPRWAKASGESYGRGPGMNALPEVKMVNLMEETMIRGAQKTIDPPLQAPDDGYVLPIKTKPGSINFYRSGASKANDGIRPIFNDARIDFGFQIMDAHRQRIRSAFYVDQLQLGQGPQMTATEVVQRTEEKMKFLGPLLGRLQVEFLAPLIDRVFNIMNRRGRFLPPPAVLQKRKLDVRYSSSIAKLQRAGEAKNIMETMSMISPFGQIDPSVFDNLNADAALRGIAGMFSFPQKFLRDQDDVEKMRAQRAKEAEARQKMLAEAHSADTLGKVAPAVKDLQESQELEAQ